TPRRSSPVTGGARSVEHREVSTDELLQCAIRENESALRQLRLAWGSRHKWSRILRERADARSFSGGSTLFQARHCAARTGRWKLLGRSGDPTADDTFRRAVRG